MTHAQKPSSKMTREERVALALRENLAKRKQQARAREDLAQEGAGANTVFTKGDTRL